MPEYVASIDVFLPMFPKIIVPHVSRLDGKRHSWQFIPFLVERLTDYMSLGSSSVTWPFRVFVLLVHSFPCFVHCIAFIALAGVDSGQGS